MSKEEPPIPVADIDDAFFAREGVDTTWTRSWVYKELPTSNPDASLVMFNISPQSQGNYYFLQDMKLVITCKLVDKDGKPLQGATDNVVPVNNLGASLFENVNLCLNDVQVTQGVNSMYPYFSLFYTMLNYGKEKKDGSLQLQGYYEDTEADYTKKYPYAERGSDKRKMMFASKNYASQTWTYFDDKSESTVIIAPVLTEFCSTSKPMVSQVAGRLTLTRAKHSFYLSDTSVTAPALDGEEDNPATQRKFEDIKPKVVISKMELLIPVKSMNPALDLKVESHIKQHGLLYNAVRMELKTREMNKGTQTFTFDTLKTGASTPYRLYFAVVADSDMNGTKGQDPFRFGRRVQPEPGTEDKAACLEMIRLSVNNESLESFDVTSTEQTLAKKYMELNEVLGHNRTTDSSLSFGIREFEMVNFIVGFDLTLARNSAVLAPHVRGRKMEGSMRLELNYDGPLPRKAWLVALLEYHSGIKVNSNRLVSYKTFT